MTVKRGPSKYTAIYILKVLTGLPYLKELPYIPQTENVRHVGRVKISV